MALLIAVQGCGDSAGTADAAVDSLSDSEGEVQGTEDAPPSHDAPERPNEVTEDSGQSPPDTEVEEVAEVAPTDSNVEDSPDTGPDSGPDSAAPEPQPLTLTLPPTLPLNVPFPVTVDGPPEFSGEVTVSVAGTARVVLLHRGRGSFSTSVSTAGTLAIEATDGWTGAASSVGEARDERLMTGTLAGDDLMWSDAEDVHLDGVVTVPAASTLTIGEDTRVLAGPNARLEVAGELLASGPILFTAGSEEPWGGLVVHQGGSAQLEGVWFLGGGGDSTKSFGHSASQPVVKASSATLTMTGGGIIDCPGKALGGFEAVMTASGILISRCDTGGEMINSSLTLSHAHVVEIPDADGVAEDDDNDGLYFESTLKVDGEVVGSTLSDVVFSLGEDDAIDHHNAHLTIERAWITGFAHEGIAASGAGIVTVEDTVATRCEQGIEAGYGTPLVTVSHCLLVENDIGLRFGDSYDWADEGTLVVSHTVSVDNTEANVLNLTDEGGPRPEAIQVSCSMVDDPAFDGHDGNMPGVPGWTAEGCVDTTTCQGAEIGPNICD